MSPRGCKEKSPACYRALTTVFAKMPGGARLTCTMPEFSHAFSGLAAGRELSHKELVRAIRFMIAAEYEAIQLYEQLADSTDNKLARKVLLDISGEEKEHVGEFRHLLSLLAPEDEAEYCEGMGEAKRYLAPLMQAGQGGGKDACADECLCREKKTPSDADSTHKLSGGEGSCEDSSCSCS